MSQVLAASRDLVDQEARNRFAQEIDCNFTVIAPAGVGKTTAIVQRIVTFAKDYEYQALPSKLSKLVVVTYTQKAADEMKSRAYEALLGNNYSTHKLQEFNKAFFGTIHSFCLKLIQAYGSGIGVATRLSLLINDDDLWHEFLNLNSHFLDIVPKGLKEDICQYINFDKLVQLSRKLSISSIPNNELPRSPKVDLKDVLSYTSKRSSQKVLEIQNELQEWLSELQENPFAVGIPEISQGDSEFKERCADAFSSLWNWLGEAAHVLAFQIAKKYQSFRISKGMISYDDMIDLAERLIKDPAIAEEIRLLDYHVILDEAQDTDTKQFSVLLGSVALNQDGFPMKGRFSMLGDPQQAIYSSRADLPTYLKIHNGLLNAKSAQMLTFNVTMRCDRAIVAHCNSVFPNILRNNADAAQINFVPLNARPWAEEGFVGKIRLDLSEEKKVGLNTNDLEKYEAELLGKKIRDMGLEGLGVSDWSEVAILAPRKNWLLPLAKELHTNGIPFQIHSRSDIKGDNPAFAWMTALLVVICSPCDSFEIVGLLREVFGQSDGEIARYVHNTQITDKDYHPLNIVSGTNVSKEDPIGRILLFLCELRNEVLELSLSDAVQHIIKKMDLKSRLFSLPDQNYDDFENVVDQILIQSILAEERGCSIEEFASFLKNEFYQLDDELTVLKGHVQCFTSHKAKGLEWPVVIVPFVFRSILFPPQEYPQVIQLGSIHPQKIVVSNHPNKKQFEELLEQHRIGELERLLYVTATRARNKLLWVDDEALFKNSKVSFGSLLNVTANGSNREVWNKLPSILPIQFNVQLREKSFHAISQDLDKKKIKEFDPFVVTQAIERSKPIFQKVVPSQLKKIVVNSNKSLKNYSSIDYGNWWHAMMEHFPWKTSSEWNSHFSAHLIQCPEVHRGQREIDLFLRSSILNDLIKETFIIQTEVPFIFQKENKIGYEGFIDFFARCEEKKRGIVIDWKTDFFESQQDVGASLKASYGLQLAIYQEAIEKIYKGTIEVFLYSTFLGELVSI